MLILYFLALLLVANATPVFAREIFRDRFAWPLDGGLRFIDGKPLLGPSKTLRGVVLSIPVTALAGQMLGFGWETGALVGVTAMAGDLLSSFTKRRLNRPSSANTPLVDQIPESLFPSLACQSKLGFGLVDILIILVVFFFGNLLFNRLGRRVLGR